MSSTDDQQTITGLGDLNFLDPAVAAQPQPVFHRLRVALEELHRRIPQYAINAGDAPVYSSAIREVTHLPLAFRCEAP